MKEVAVPFDEGIGEDGHRLHCDVAHEGGVQKERKGLVASKVTPVIDLKPYIPDNDLVKRARVAKWIYQLRTPAREVRGML